jgi:AraC-like DNA-binding protein
MRRKRLSDDAVYEKMKQLMLEKQLFLQPDLTRDQLAREVLTNRTYITRALKGRGLNFSQFVNSFRADYAIGLMTGEAYRDAAPVEIAEMSGFSSVDTMNRYIKKSAGLTACALQKRLSDYPVFSR